MQFQANQAGRRDQQGIQQQQFGDQFSAGQHQFANQFASQQQQFGDQFNGAARSPPLIDRRIQQNQFGDQYRSGQHQFADQFNAQQGQQGFNNQMANQNLLGTERPFPSPAVQANQFNQDVTQRRGISNQEMMQQRQDPFNQAWAASGIRRAGRESLIQPAAAV